MKNAWIDEINSVTFFPQNGYSYFYETRQITDMFKTKFDHICEPYLTFTSLVGTSLLKDFSFATQSLESLVMCSIIN